MTSTTSKRGAGAKFLALLASLTMIVVGLVGVAIAAPASAVNNTGELPEGCYKLEGVFGSVSIGDKFDVGPYVTIEVTQIKDEVEGKGEAVAGKWTAAAGYVVTDSGWKSGAFEGGAGTGTSGTWETGGGKGLSNIVFCVEGTSGTVPGGTYNYCYEGDNDSVSWKGASWGPEEEFNTKAKAEERVAKNEAAAMEEVPSGATKGSCPSGNVPGGSYPYCYEGGEDAVTWQGATYGPEGDYKTEDAAKKAVADREARALEGVPSGATAGSCPPPPPPPPNDPPTVTPPTVTPPTVEAAVVAAPAPAAVAAPAPATVAVPAAATVPAAVPAGEGSGSTIPMWALAMIVLGAAGMATAGLKLVRASK